MTDYIFEGDRNLTYYKFTDSSIILYVWNISEIPINFNSKILKENIHRIVNNL